MGKRIKLFADCRCELSESPMWHEKENCLYWHGFHGELYRKKLNDDVNDFECFQLNIGRIGSMVFTDGDYMLLFADGGKVWKWKPYSEPALYRDFNKSLFNDVIADSEGRVYCGMLADHFFEPDKVADHGSFWLFDNKADLISIEEKTGKTPNGIRFSPRLDTLYFAVTDHNCVYAYDYDKATGKLTNKRVFASDCLPDGIATDVNGNVWVTCCKPGGALLCFNPKGEIIDEIYFPVYRIISVAFGGRDKSIMFVTTASEGNAVGEHDGGVFMIEDIAVGAEEFMLKLE